MKLIPAILIFDFHNKRYKKTWTHAKKNLQGISTITNSPTECLYLQLSSLFKMFFKINFCFGKILN